MTNIHIVKTTDDTSPKELSMYYWQNFRNSINNRIPEKQLFSMRSLENQILLHQWRIIDS